MIRKIVIALAACFTLLSVSSAQAAVNPVYRQCDSIMKLMPRLKGKAKLDALLERCNLALYQDKAEFELKCLNDFIDETHRQNNAEMGAWGRYNRLCCYLNYGKRKEFEAELPSDLDFCLKHHSFFYYYDMRYSLVKSYIGDTKYLTAIQELKSIYSDAQKRNISYGKGIALSAMGQCYMALYNLKESEKDFSEAVKLLPYDSSVLYDTYGYYFMLLKNKQPAKLLQAAKGCIKKIDEYIAKKVPNGDSSTFALNYMYCYDAMANAEMSMNHLPEAKTWIEKAKAIADNMGTGTQLSIMDDIIRYYELTKDYSKALYYAKLQMDLTHDCSKADIISVKEQYAHVLFKAGRGMEAAAIYDKLTGAKDSLNAENTNNQLNEMSTIFGLDKEKLEHRNTQNVLYGAIVCIILLIAFITGTIIYLRRLREKNRNLFMRNEELEKARQQVEAINDAKLPDEMEADELLYQRLCRLMKEKEVFKQYETNRDTLANELGTNFKYLADAIHKFADGSTVNDFINLYRLRYAAQQFNKNSSHTLNDICFESGFNSYKTFYRLFREMYGVSPSVYQQIAKTR